MVSLALGKHSVVAHLRTDTCFVPAPAVWPLNIMLFASILKGFDNNFDPSP
jgi:hypothetical protein